MRSLQILFSIFWGAGCIGNGILLLYVEWTYLRQGFIQIFNPFLQLQVFGTLLTIPFFWIFLVMAILGYYAVNSVGQSLKENYQRPEPQPQVKQVVPSPKIQTSFRTQAPAQNAVQPLRTNASPQQRSYIQFHIDKLESLATNEWSNVQTLKRIHYELEFRQSRRAQAFRECVEQRLMQLQSPQFVWPTTIATPSSQGLSSDVFRYELGLLGHCGYRVGANGLPESKRRQILDRVFLQPLPPINDTTYLSQWGEPQTSQRLQKLAESIAAFARNERRRNNKTCRGISENRGQ